MVILGEVCILIEVDAVLTDFEARRLESVVESETREFLVLLERYVRAELGYVARLTLDRG